MPSLHSLCTHRHTTVASTQTPQSAPRDATFQDTHSVGIFSHFHPFRELCFCDDRDQKRDVYVIECVLAVGVEGWGGKGWELPALSTHQSLSSRWGCGRVSLGKWGSQRRCCICWCSPRAPSLRPAAHTPRLPRPGAGSRCWRRSRNSDRHPGQWRWLLPVARTHTAHTVERDADSYEKDNKAYEPHRNVSCGSRTLFMQPVWSLQHLPYPLTHPLSLFTLTSLAKRSHSLNYNTHTPRLPISHSFPVQKEATQMKLDLPFLSSASGRLSG